MAEKKVDLKSMTKQEKRDYIWYYYKTHIITGLLAILLVGSLIYEVTSKDQIIFSLTLFGASEPTLYYEEIEEDLTQLVAPDSNAKETVRVQFFALNEVEESFDEITDLYQQKMMTQVAAKELDLVIMGENDFKFYANQNMFEPLNEVTGIDWSLVADQDLLKDSTTQLIYGIKMSENSLLNTVNYDSEGKVLALINNSNHKEMATKIINYLLPQ